MSTVHTGPDKMKLLIVEDDESLLRLYDEFLASSTLQVLQATDGVSALESIRRHQPDLVVLDINLPGMSGFEVMHALRQDLATKSLPVLMLSGQDDRDTINQAFAAGATDFIAKPANLAVLKARIRIFGNTSTERMQVTPSTGSLASHPVPFQLPPQPHVDPLTGLFNRQGATAYLSRLVNLATLRKQQIGAICIGLNRFKLVNAGIGHAGGDALLKQVAGRLNSCLRSGDTVARLGGDEFLIILPAIPQHGDAEKVVDKLATGLGRAFNIEGQQIQLSAGIGVCLFPEHARDAETLMQHASAAMNVSKTTALLTPCYFRPGMGELARESLTLESDIGLALDQGELSVQYQPQFDLASGAVCAAEALLRWQHPVAGLLYPDQFLPLIQDQRMMLRIGNWVLEQACRQAGYWRNELSMPVQIAVNINPCQIVEPAFPSRVSELLYRSGLPPGSLTIEITEHATLGDSANACAALQNLEKIGVRISIDDFGTGYSSLSYLQQFPFHELKIDRDFIRDLCENQNSSKLVTAILAIGRSFDSLVVAEGIETRLQLETLDSIGCRRGQGYFLGHPVSADDFETRYTRANITEPGAIA